MFGPVAGVTNECRGVALTTLAEADPPSCTGRRRGARRLLPRRTRWSAGPRTVAPPAARLRSPRPGPPELAHRPLGPVPDAALVGGRAPDGADRRGRPREVRRVRCVPHGDRGPSPAEDSPARVHRL